MTDNQDGPDIHDLVIAGIRERKAKGLAEYGRPHRPHNGLDGLREAYEEALDMAFWLRQEIEERAAASQEVPLPDNAVRELVAWLLWCISQGYTDASDREIHTNWMGDDAATLHPDDVTTRERLLAMAGEIIAAAAPPIRTDERHQIVVWLHAQAKELGEDKEGLTERQRATRADTARSLIAAIAHMAAHGMDGNDHG